VYLIIDDYHQIKKEIKNKETSKVDIRGDNS